MSDSDFSSAFGRSRHTHLSLDRLGEYYEGSQPLSYLHPDLQKDIGARLRSLVVNWPRLVVDSIEDRLDVEGFRVGDSDEADADLWRIWQANDLDEWSQLCHLEALIYGRCFALVWADEDDETTPRITIESAKQVQVVYDPNSHRIRQATKTWSFADYEFRTVFDRQWIFRHQRPVGDVNGEWVERSEPIENVLGVVPVVQFVNRPTLLRPQGESEMTDVLPLTDAINKLCTDMMTSAEYHAMPRRWATGIDLGGSEESAARTTEQIRARWEEARASKVWATDNPNAKFGQFDEASLDNFVSAINMLTARVAALSGLPPHYFGQAGDNPASADALRSSEAPLVKKAQRKQRVFGGAWERVMRLAMLVRDGEVPAEAASMETIWRSAETPTIAQQADAAVKLVQAGIVTPGQARQDLGYTPVQQERMRDEESAAALGPVRAQLDEAARLQREDGLSQPAAFAAVGLLQSAAMQQ